MDSRSTRTLDIALTVSPFGKSGMLRATSEQIPNLIVMGTDDDDLWGCLSPVIESVFNARGETVQVITLDRSKGTRDVRVHLEVARRAAITGDPT